ncbi:response regulator [Caballeronia sp. Lep1P3]|uniref:response regulator n=1 Tax=Caballeronia sp. Lep1P3 TaxID=2878150 RepID=UPI001FD1FAE4|nr:response regulator [Caballeronia sp. Lep1P3]
MSHVLLIDDDPLLRDAMQALLTDCGHAVTVAADGLEGLHAAMHRTPDAIVSDVNMPLVDGREMVRILKSLPELWDVPILLMSGAIRSTAVPVVAMLRKPVDPANLVALLDRMTGAKPAAAFDGHAHAADVAGELAAAPGGSAGARCAANVRAHAYARMIRRGVELMRQQKNRLDVIREAGADPRDAQVLYDSLVKNVLTLVGQCGVVRCG